MHAPRQVIPLAYQIPKSLCLRRLVDLDRCMCVFLNAHTLIEAVTHIIVFLINDDSEQVMVPQTADLEYYLKWHPRQIRRHSP